MDYGHWKWFGKCIDNKHFGFLYKITRKETGQYYVGIKQLFKQVKLKPLKGKKNKRIRFKDSDWRTYTGSGVISDEARDFPERFSFEILSLYDTKRELQYAEVEYLVKNGCLFNQLCYNQMLNCRLRFHR
jgi:hypothetical protein